MPYIVSWIRFFIISPTFLPYSSKTSHVSPSPASSSSLPLPHLYGRNMSTICSIVDRSSCKFVWRTPPSYESFRISNKMSSPPRGVVIPTMVRSPCVCEFRFLGNVVTIVEVNSRKKKLETCIGFYLQSPYYICIWLLFFLFRFGLGDS